MLEVVAVDHDNRAHAKLEHYHKGFFETARPQLDRQANGNDLERGTPKHKASQGSDGEKQAFRVQGKQRTAWPKGRP